MRYKFKNTFLYSTNEDVLLTNQMSLIRFNNVNGVVAVSQTHVRTADLSAGSFLPG